MNIGRSSPPGGRRDSMRLAQGQVRAILADRPRPSARPSQTPEGIRSDDEDEEAGHRGA